MPTSHPDTQTNAYELRIEFHKRKISIELIIFEYGKKD